MALAAPVRFELLAGASRVQMPIIKHLLSPLPLFFPTENTWVEVERWLDRTATSGHQFGFVDLLIAAIVAEQDGEIWSLDVDFGRLASLGLVRRFAG